MRNDITMDKVLRKLSEDKVTEISLPEFRLKCQNVRFNKQDTEMILKGLIKINCAELVNGKRGREKRIRIKLW